jgi:hypothetical protein
MHVIMTLNKLGAHNPEEHAARATAAAGVKIADKLGVPEKKAEKMMREWKRGYRLKWMARNAKSPNELGELSREAEIFLRFAGSAARLGIQANRRELDLGVVRQFIWRHKAAGGVVGNERKHLEALADFPFAVNVASSISKPKSTRFLKQLSSVAKEIAKNVSMQWQAEKN